MWIEIHVPSNLKHVPSNLKYYGPQGAYGHSFHPWNFSGVSIKEVNCFIWGPKYYYTSNLEEDLTLVRSIHHTDKLTIINFATKRYIYYEKSNSPTIEELKDIFKENQFATVTGTQTSNRMVVNHPEIDKMISVFRELKINEILD